MSNSGKGVPPTGGDWTQIHAYEFRRVLPDGSKLLAWLPEGGRYWEYAHVGTDGVAGMYRSGADTYTAAREHADDYATAWGYPGPPTPAPVIYPEETQR